ncbi:MAG: hypothetical protein GY953_38130, partial [bacterium]|nr:hypothetical protein [bacterium]
RTYSEKQKRPVLLTELGYNRSHAAAVRPWESHTDGESSRALQERCMRVALTAIEGEPAVVGSFLWKWFPQPYSVGRNFRLANPRMKAVIRGVWSDDPAASAPSPSSR